MKRALLFFILTMTVFSLASAESLPANGATVFAPQAAASENTPLPLQQGELSIDFDLLTPENPAATPIAVDPIDKPTPTPMPTPSYVYEKYSNEEMGVSFYIPYTWLLNPNTNRDTTIQFVEPRSEMMEPDGYQTRITIEKVNMGLSQTSSDALARLESTLEQLEQSFTVFTPGDIVSGKVGDYNGHYCYYKAEYNDGTKNYVMNGRIIIVAHEKALYQIRITTPRAWYSYYENVFRKVRSTFKVL